MPQETHAQKLARWAKTGTTGGEAVAAATVIPIRDSPDGLEVLMLRRNSKIAFGGMWVFPGGRVDDADREHRGDTSADEVEHARHAAVREAVEEAGLRFDLEALLPFSHWTPPAIGNRRRFLTWFFLAEAPAGEVRIDGGEIHEHRWLAPAAALESRDEGEIELAPPTFVTLFELASWTSPRDALSAVRTRTPERFATRIAVEERGPIALWHGDAAYESGEAGREGPRHRLTMHDDGWRYLRSWS